MNTQMVSRAFTLSLAQIALPGNAEGWTILLDDPQGNLHSMFNIVQCTESAKVSATNPETRAGPESSDSRRVRAAVEAARPGKTAEQCVLEVFQKLEDDWVFAGGIVQKVRKGIERYKDAEWVMCPSDPEEGKNEKNDGGKGEDGKAKKKK
ncbi:hypothetical protein BJY00DRAFT_316968 [Aspergillus carlsbadensis]|nr:hypothetical protein BJY00DRAFT_316968 [Aspergillus carlsbadensis]